MEKNILFQRNISGLPCNDLSLDLSQRLVFLRRDCLLFLASSIMWWNIGEEKGMELKDEGLFVIF